MRNQETQAQAAAVATRRMVRLIAPANTGCVTLADGSDEGLQIAVQDGMIDVPAELASQLTAQGFVALPKTAPSAEDLAAADERARTSEARRDALATQVEALREEVASAKELHTSAREALAVGVAELHEVTAAEDKVKTSERNLQEAEAAFERATHLAFTARSEATAVRNARAVSIDEAAFAEKRKEAAAIPVQFVDAALAMRALLARRGEIERERQKLHPKAEPVAPVTLSAIADQVRDRLVKGQEFDVHTMHSAESVRQWIAALITVPGEAGHVFEKTLERSVLLRG